MVRAFTALPYLLRRDIGEVTSSLTHVTSVTLYSMTIPLVWISLGDQKKET